MTSLKKSGTPNQKNFFRVQTRRLAVSLHTSTRFVTLTGAEKFPRKAMCVSVFFSQKSLILARHQSVKMTCFAASTVHPFFSKHLVHLSMTPLVIITYHFCCCIMDECLKNYTTGYIYLNFQYKHYHFICLIIYAYFWHAFRIARMVCNATEVFP